MSFSRKVYIKDSGNPYSWQQTDEALLIQIPGVRTVLMKDVDIFLSDIYVKVNVTTRNYFVVLDLLHEIDFEHKKTKVQLGDEGLELYLFKLEVGEWTNLIKRDSKENLKRRREDAVERFNDRQKELLEAADKAKRVLDKTAVEEQMAVESHQRKEIKNKKKAEKQEAEDDLYRDIEQI
jgi:hypothetical protein